MKISGKHRVVLYRAINESITLQRIENKKIDELSSEQVDLMMFRLTHKIWDKVKEALGIEE